MVRAIVSVTQLFRFYICPIINYLFKCKSFFGTYESQTWNKWMTDQLMKNKVHVAGSSLSAGSYSAAQEVPQSYRTYTVHHHDHKSSPSMSTSRPFSSVLLPWGSLNNILYEFVSPHVYYVSHPSHLPSVLTLTTSGTEYKLWSFSLHNLHSPIIFSLLDPYPVN
jgi:hypothetical protein